MTDDPIVGNVAVGTCWRLPLENNLGGGVGRGNGIQRDRGLCGSEKKSMKNTE